MPRLTQPAGGDIVDAIRDHLAKFSVDEIVHLHLIGTALRPIVAPGIPVVSNKLVSRPAVFRRQPLAERWVRLSPHTAPIRRTCRSCRYASVRTAQVGCEPASQGSGRPQPCAPESA